MPCNTWTYKCVYNFVSMPILDIENNHYCIFSKYYSIYFSIIQSILNNVIVYEVDSQENQLC